MDDPLVNFKDGRLLVHELRRHTQKTEYFLQ